MHSFGFLLASLALLAGATPAAPQSTGATPLPDPEQHATRPPWFQVGGTEPLPEPGGHATRPGTLPYRFVAIGDFGTTNAGSFAVAAFVRALDPAVILTLGDNNYPDGEAGTIDANIGQHYHEFIHPYTGSFGAGAEFNRFFPTLGNHDWRAEDAQPYLDYFELPHNERYYTIRRGPVQFFALDSDENEPDGVAADSVQAAWLRASLARSDAPFKVVFMHHAPYCSSSNHGSHPELQWPFAVWGASIVLTGHDHLYERLNVSGFPYVVNGLGGADRYNFDEPLGGSQLRFSADHGVLVADVDEDFARFRFLTAGDTVQDEFLLPRGGLGAEVTELFQANAVWKYLDTGIDPGLRWRELAFDDSGWASGPAELGYGDGDEATVVGTGGPPGERAITTWFRRTFFHARPQDFEALQLRLRYDDGAVVYLNGAEVLRVNMPGGTITANTRASRAIAAGDETEFHTFRLGTEHLFDRTLRLPALGWNVLAIEIHQSAPSSPDISMAAELVGLGGSLLLPRASSWRYLDTGVAPEPSWTAADFDDSQWPVGRAQFGFGENDEQTLVATGNTTTWFRNEFTVARAETVRWLECRLLRDDGAIVYLNGREAARFNLPRGEVTAATFASFNVGGGQEGHFDATSLDPRLLADGVNTIAVELHQAGATANDLSFDLELVAH